MPDMDLSTLPQTSCDCPRCKSMCHGRPCWGTPEDIARIIDAGHESSLMLEWYEGDGKVVELLAPAIEGFQGQGAPYWPQGRCVFLDPDDHCILHAPGLKPIEGRVTSCKGGINLTAVHKAIISSWESDDGRALVRMWRSRRPVRAERPGPLEFVKKFLLCESDEEAFEILMNYTAFPFADLATIEAQLAHIKAVGLAQAMREMESQACP